MAGRLEIPYTPSPEWVARATVDPRTLLRCVNTQCRVVTYTGVAGQVCPNCYGSPGG